MKLKTNLTLCRKESPLLQQDVAQLLKIDTGLFSRYEKGRRPPTLDFILGFHILFGASMKDIYTDRYMLLQDTIITRSVTLIEQLETEQSSKRTNSRIAYLKHIVNGLNNTKYE